MTYNKTALWLHTLERYIGWRRLQRGMALFFARFAFKHPAPEDFFAALNEGAGRDLTWYFDQVYRSSNVFDYAVLQLTSRRDANSIHTDLVVQRLGEAVFPVDVEVTFADGSKAREHWDGRDRWKLYTYERADKADYAQVDPNRTLLLDVNYTNNSMTLSPKTDAATTKWALKWMVWVQDLMLTYGFFV
jgi:aminopeptidase N